MTHEAHEAHGAHDVIDIEPLDPDISLITEWLTHELPPERDAAVFKRLHDDQAFFDKVAPVMKIWFMPISFRELLAEGRALEASAAEPMEAPHPDESPYSEHAEYAGDPELDASPLPTFPRPAWLDAVPTFPTFDRVFAGKDHTHDDGRDTVLPHRWFTPTFRRRFATMSTLSGAAVMLIGISTFGYSYFSAQPHVVSRVVPTVADTSRPELQRAPVQQLIGAQVVETKEGETRELDLRGGSHVTLRPSSRLTFAYMPGRGISAALDGEAAVQVTRGDFVMRVVTSVGGSVMMTPGSYAVRCEPGCSAMLLSVASGIGSIRADTSAHGLSVATGQKGQLVRGHAPELAEHVLNYPKP